MLTSRANYQPCNKKKRKPFSFYQGKYVYFMTAETLLSLVCFILVVFLEFDKLPGYYERIVHYSEQGYNIVYLTPYYTLGWLSTHGYFRRNAGMFWEPGAHAVYLNLAILFIFGGALVLLT